VLEAIRGAALDVDVFRASSNALLWALYGRLTWSSKWPSPSDAAPSTAPSGAT